MRSRALCCSLVLMLCVTYAFASNRHATLTVVTGVTEDVTAPSGGAWSALTTITSPSPISSPCPDGSNGVDGSGSPVTQCRWSNLSDGTTKVKGTTVRALLTTSTGEVFDISIFCSRYYGSCPEPKAGTAYAVELNDDPKYLKDYAKRREYGPMAIKLSPDGKKKVSYAIIFAMTAGSKQSHPD